MTPAIISAIIVSAGSMVIFYFKLLLSIERRLTRLETKMDLLWSGITKMVSDRITGASPPSKERVKGLLKKFGEGILSYDEAKELKPILEEELEKARRIKDDPLVVNLTLLLTALEAKIRYAEEGR